MSDAFSSIYRIQLPEETITNAISVINKPGELPMPFTTDYDAHGTSEDHCSALWVVMPSRETEAVLMTVTDNTDILDTQIVVYLVARSRCNLKSRAASGEVLLTDECAGTLILSSIAASSTFARAFKVACLVRLLSIGWSRFQPSVFCSPRWCEEGCWCASRRRQL